MLREFQGERTWSGRSQVVVKGQLDKTARVESWALTCTPCDSEQLQAAATEAATPTNLLEPSNLQYLMSTSVRRRHPGLLMRL